MDFIEKNKKVVILVLLLASAFYWYEWRPSQIRRECNSITKPRITSRLLPYSTSPEANDAYLNCVRSKGLGK